jgi:2,5-diketo-D-gluconate reductase B
MAVVGYCPLARGKVSGDAVLQRIGRAHGKSAAQVSLRFLQQWGIIPIPRTSKRERLAENLGSLEFKLTDAELVEIDMLRLSGLRFVSPSQALQWDS